MILIKNIYAFILYVSDSGLQYNKHNSYWYGVQYQIDRLPLGRGTNQWKWYCPPNIALYINSYCVYCIEDQNPEHTI